MRFYLNQDVIARMASNIASGFVRDAYSNYGKLNTEHEEALAISSVRIARLIAKECGYDETPPFTRYSESP